MSTLFCIKEKSMLDLHVEKWLISLPWEIHGKNVHVCKSSKIKTGFLQTNHRCLERVFFFKTDVYQND